MNDVFTRAAALRGLLGSSPARELQQPVAESVIKCAHELMNASAPAEALQLIASAEAEIHKEDGVWRLRLEIARVRALRLAGQSRDSLNQIAHLYEADRDLLRRLPSEFFDLRISEAADLIQLSRYDEALDKLVRIHTELVSQPDSRQLAACAYQMSSAEIFRGKHASARRYVLEAVVSARRSRDDFTEALALDNLNRLERAVCHWATAEESGVEALKIFVETNCWRYANSARRGLGIIAWKRGRLDAAMKLAKECSSEAERLGEEALVWYAALLRAMILLCEGKYADATRALSESESWKVTASQSRPSLLTTEFLGDIHLEQGQAAPALELYDEVWPKALALVPKGDIVAELRRRRAECYLLLGRSEDAYAEAKTGLEHCRELGDRYEEAATYRVLALSAAALGKTSEAKKWFEQACGSQLKSWALRNGKSQSRDCRGRRPRLWSPPGSPRQASLPAAA